MSVKSMPSLDYLNSILEIKDGLLYNKITRNSRAIKGNLAGSDLKKYRIVTLLGRPYLVHRITYYMTNGNCPDFIDHIDGNTKNNHIDNLRPATLSENQRNKKVGINNKSGIKNVSWSQREKKWYVCLNYCGKNKNLGYYNDLELAELVATEARDKFHGKFANHGLGV